MFSSHRSPAKVKKPSFDKSYFSMKEPSLSYLISSLTVVGADKRFSTSYLSQIDHIIPGSGRKGFPSNRMEVIPLI